MLNSLALALAMLAVRTPSAAPSVVGEWNWSTSGPSIGGDPNGDPQQGHRVTRRYLLRPDGTFRQETATLLNARGHRMTSSFSAEGRYELYGDTIRFVVDGGHQRGEDNLIDSGNYDRPAPDDLVRRLCVSRRFAIRRENGARTFTLAGSDPRDTIVYRSVR